MLQNRKRAGALLGVVLGAIGMTGCAAPDPDSPPVAAALEWVRHLCNGDYTEANALSSHFHRFEQDYPDQAAQLALADDLGEERLDELTEEGIDTTPQLKVAEFLFADDEEDLAIVTVTGSCFGETFTTEVTVSDAGDGLWSAADRIPTWNVGARFVIDGISHPAAPAQVETGARFHDPADPSNLTWILPPGEHAVAFEDHFLLEPVPELTLEVGMFDLDTEWEDPVPATTERVGPVFEQFVADCGEEGVCLLPASAVRVDGGPLATEAIAPTPAAFTEGSLEFTGSVAVFGLTFTDTTLTEPNPYRWTIEDPQTGTARADALGAEIATFHCPTGQTCTVTREEFFEAAQSLDEVYFAEVDGEIRVTELSVSG
ncbi:hypothetical protein [Gulosibacter sp. 10]|uniref:hypothetical protein n=1 Tax=Gulosibacter sp. 10 TaxID=1255570 RepID=UPI00097EAE57|nr:hypothetical protein [Gulosibacter sp. 10]SJM60562.1 hypothetical protein FM112_07250 [Gulosibacter sp. 10]